MLLCLQELTRRARECSKAWVLMVAVLTQELVEPVVWVDCSRTETAVVSRQGCPNILKSLKSVIKKKKTCSLNDYVTMYIPTFCAFMYVHVEAVHLLLIIEAWRLKTSARDNLRSSAGRSQSIGGGVFMAGAGCPQLWLPVLSSGTVREDGYHSQWLPWLGPCGTRPVPQMTS